MGVARHNNDVSETLWRQDEVVRRHRGFGLGANVGLLTRRH